MYYRVLKVLMNLIIDSEKLRVQQQFRDLLLVTVKSEPLAV